METDSEILKRHGIVDGAVIRLAPSGDGARKSTAPRRRVGSGSLVGAQRATLSKTIRGQWTVWKKGTAVWARESAPGEYFIRRVRQLGDGKLSCQNEMAFVPLSALRFQRPNMEITHTASDAHPLDASRALAAPNVLRVSTGSKGAPTTHKIQ